MDILAKHLPRLDIPCFYLALYDNQEKENASGNAYQMSKLVLAYDKTRYQDNGRAKLETGELHFLSRQLLPEVMFPDHRYSLIVEPLNFQDKQLGFVMFEAGPLNGVIYESLRGQISSALQGALLLEQVKRNALQLDTVVVHTLSASEEIQKSISETSLQAQTVSKTAQVSIDVTKTGNDAILKTVSGMETIRRQVEDIAQSILTLTKYTKQIGEIINAMENIVSQSKILSINASIQAARYGNKAQGFSVVAHEMSKLAEQSREATKKISYILNEIQTSAAAAVIATKEGSKGVEEGMKLAGNAGESIHNLSAIIEEAARLALQISKSTEQQTNSIDKLVKEVHSIKEASTQTSSSFKEIGL
jgi:methyl-accepting chemotaxis protein